MKKSDYFKKIILLVFIFSISFSVFSQETEKEDIISIGADFQSRYVWRGLQLGGVSIQPSFELALGNFAVGTWGSYSFTGTQTAQEADLYASYTIAEMFTILVSDYYFPNDLGGYNYFDYRADSTGHLFEATLSFNGTEKIPLSFLVATNFYGADTKKANGDLVYSTYAELSYSKTIVNTDFSAFVGGALNSPEVTPGFYGNTKPVIINCGIKAEKEIVITDKYSLPINSALIFNPNSKAVFLTFGVSL
jgi:hypothetical protein